MTERKRAEAVNSIICTSTEQQFGTRCFTFIPFYHSSERFVRAWLPRSDEPCTNLAIKPTQSAPWIEWERELHFTNKMEHFFLVRRFHWSVVQLQCICDSIGCRMYCISDFHDIFLVRFGEKQRMHCVNVSVASGLCTLVYGDYRRESKQRKI